MKKTFNYNIKYEGKPAKVKVEVELTSNNVFTASGSLIIPNRVLFKDDEYIMGGQCLDELKEYINDETFNTIYVMWKKHHLNDMHAGTEKQEAALNEAGLTQYANKYKECCDYLESINLLKDDGYKFGTGWLKREIPEEDLNIIKGLLN